MRLPFIGRSADSTRARMFYMGLFMCPFNASIKCLLYSTQKTTSFVILREPDARIKQIISYMPHIYQGLCV
jgi:hypothetical protein